MKGQDQCYPLFCGALDRGSTHDRRSLACEVATIFFGDGAPKAACEAGALPNQCDPLHPWLLQKQTHAVEVDDGMTDVQHIHPKNASDDCTALLPYEIWQCSCAEFVRKFTAAFPRRVFGKQDWRAMGPRPDRALDVPM